MNHRLESLSFLALFTLAGCEKGTARPDEASPWVELDCVVEARLSHGKLSTTLPSGEAFAGTYINVVRDTTDASLQPYHAGWARGFEAGAPAALAEWKQSQQGHVLGLLDGDQSTKMRCVLTLDMADVGIEGGGEGTCELSSGETLRARFSTK